MHSHSIEHWQHSHAFLGERHGRNERRTWFVVALTAAMMVAEIVGGSIYGSMALVADGWHMSTHAAALGIAGLGYLFARRHVHDPRFSLGTGKFGDLAAFASAIILAMIALYIAVESIERLTYPVTIHYNEAIVIAVIGLAVNLLSAWLLKDDHKHDHGHSHGFARDHREHDSHEEDRHGHATHHHARDLNLRAAYVHVLADALTSVLAISGLTTAWFFGWRWIDPAIGIVGSAVIASWAFGLIRSCSAVLLDTVPDPRLVEEVRERLEVNGDKVADLHLWRVGPGHSAMIVSVVSDTPQPPSAYKRLVAGLHGLSHVTVEVNACPGHHVH